MAGKTSLMVALYRMVELDQDNGGTISIDGVDCSALGLDLLRSNITIIPQDPLLFTGTVRSNLDPFNSVSDSEIWLVLERAHLAAAIRALPAQLSDPVTEGGENFSMGQRCQLCLARAMLRHAKVLLMDEATASIDIPTDTLIQLSLRRDFSDRTLITIAHRLHTIIDYDRVLVMMEGQVAEFDSPARLLRDPHSAFYHMVHDTGASNAALLTDLAMQAERGLLNTEQMLQIGAAMAPGASASGLASPSVLMPVGSAKGMDSELESSTSTVRWHGYPEDGPKLCFSTWRRLMGFMDCTDSR
jgi:ATP-binding cassette subfamily C (CFTR/MRP) protein 1